MAGLDMLFGSRFDKGAVDRVFLNALKDESAVVRKRAADYFGNCCHGRPGKSTLGSEDLLQGLIHASRDTSGAVREAAVRAFRQVDHPEAALSRLREALHDPEAEVRAASLFVISRMKPPPREVLPEVRALLEDPDETVRWQATIAVQALASEN